MKFNRKTHITERQLRDLSGLTIDALLVRSKTDPKFPEVLFVNNAQQLVYDKEKALEWITWISHKPETELQVVPARQPKPLAQQGEYKPKPHPRQREIDRHPKPISMSGIGNGLNLGGREGK